MARGKQVRVLVFPEGEAAKSRPEMRGAEFVWIQT